MSYKRYRGVDMQRIKIIMKKQLRVAAIQLLAMGFSFFMHYDVKAMEKPIESIGYVDESFGKMTIQEEKPKRKTRARAKSETVPKISNESSAQQEKKDTVVRRNSEEWKVDNDLYFAIDKARGKQERLLNKEEAAALFKVVENGSLEEKRSILRGLELKFSLNDALKNVISDKDRENLLSDKTSYEEKQKLVQKIQQESVGDYQSYDLSLFLFMNFEEAKARKTGWIPLYEREEKEEEMIIQKPEEKKKKKRIRRFSTNF